MIVFDFDDTLYSHAVGAIPQSAQEALRQLHAAGHVLVIATGRGPESVDFIRSQLPVPFETMILLNGQIVYHKGEKVAESFVQLPSMERIIEKAKQSGIAYGGYSTQGEIVDHMNDRVAAVWEDFGAPLPAVMKGFERHYALYQGHLYMTQEEAAWMGNDLDDYVLNWSHEYLMNLIVKAAGKSQGIRSVIERLGVRHEQTYAFGDGFNDEDMLEYVAHGIAMGNATERLKQVADHVTGTADGDGIAQALAYYKLI